MTAAEIGAALQQLNPPIVTTIRTVERDFAAIRTDARRYISAANFDAAFEVGTALARHELIARKATQMALAANGDSARWARVAVMATEAKTRLLQDVNLIDRTIGRLIVDDGQRTDRIPSGAELVERFRDVIVTDAEITSEAELAWHYGDAAASEAAAREADERKMPR